MLKCSIEREKRNKSNEITHTHTFQTESERELVGRGAKKPIEKQTSQKKSFWCGGAIKRTFEPNKNNNKKKKKITQKRLEESGVSNKRKE